MSRLPAADVLQTEFRFALPVGYADPAEICTGPHGCVSATAL